MLNLTRKVIYVLFIWRYILAKECSITIKTCCDSSTRLALQYIIAKQTVCTLMYKTKVDKPCINFCSLWLTATLRDKMQHLLLLMSLWHTYVTAWLQQQIFWLNFQVLDRKCIGKS